jgi:hypothetical protein
MTAATLKPIFSSHKDDLDTGDSINSFVISLGERIDMLQDAEIEGDLSQLAALAGGLIIAADKAGFEPLSALARRLETACFDDDAKDAHARVCELTDIAHRVRLGHKGSV